MTNLDWSVIFRMSIMREVWDDAYISIYEGVEI